MSESTNTAAAINELDMDTPEKIEAGYQRRMDTISDLVEEILVECGEYEANKAEARYMKQLEEWHWEVLDALDPVDVVRYNNEQELEQMMRDEMNR